MKPHLMTSAMPEIISFLGRVSRVSRSTRTPAGGWKRPDEVLALGGVDAGLAAHGGVHHAEQAGGHVDDLDAAQPGGGNEPGEVGHGTAADGDHGVRTGEVVLPQHLPAEGGHLDVLALFGVGNLGRERGEARRGKLLPDGVAGEAQRPGVNDQDTFDPLPQQPGEAGQQAAAHNDVVILTGRLPGDFDDG